eukprot:CAMPEP_0119546338 /NCGR_PEP_ID=MMETSP1352-20130426/805_1 /TAXON_ID=265584 /ORGANISM="Stauroneis constricta, Strain CCMP1120" /LENGTH=818 /DNA_ID=CAMNT_0007591033 /DNA_START=20 /DNA_END=2476 /DNA_ORIENTATION=-
MTTMATMATETKMNATKTDAEEASESRDVAMTSSSLVQGTNTVEEEIIFDTITDRENDVEVAVKADHGDSKREVPSGGNDADAAAAATPQQVSSSSSSTTSSSSSAAAGRGQSGTTNRRVSRATRNGGDGGPKGAATPDSSIVLRWSRLKKAVTVQENKVGLMRSSIAGPIKDDTSAPLPAGAGGGRRASTGPTQKVILNEVSAFAAPGQVLALLGPSGSGKTTLLNALSGRFSLDSGVISVNGRSVSASNSSMKRFVSQVAYVRQDDIFFTDLTVRDQLAYTAFLRLPQRWTRQKKLEKVDNIVGLLRLSKVQNSPIGMLSGGEKKRVNIGTELLTNPSCLLLDEPTSGLDSTNAVALVKVLQHLARYQRKTVIVSIHQPSSGLFMSFDRLLMMASGNVVYFGSPQKSIPYLKEQGMACPEGYNLADHWMDLLVVDGTEGAAADDDDDEDAYPLLANSDEENPSKVADTTGKSATTSLGGMTTTMIGGARDTLIAAWDGESIAKEIDTHFINTPAPKRESISSNADNTTTTESKYGTSWSTQYRVLTHRAMKNSRTAIFTPLNLIKSTAIAVVAGLLWFQLEYTERDIHDRTSYIFFTMTYWVFDSMFGALMAFPPEKQIIAKERASSSYHLSAYFLAKTTSEAPTRLTLPLLYMTISYWMAGIANDFGIFVASTLISLLSVLAGESLGLLIGASIDRMDRALTIATVLTLSTMLMGGFYVENIPSFISWAKYLSPFKYSFDASRFVIFDRDMPCDGSGQLQDLCASATDTVKRDDLLDFLGVEQSLGFHIGMLIVLGVVPRYLAYLALKYRKAGER